MNNAPNKFKTTQDVDQWLTNGGEMPARRPVSRRPRSSRPRERSGRPPQRFHLPKLQLPQFGKKRSASKTRQAAAQPGKAKQPKVVTATISGLIFAAIVLLAETGIWGFYCYSRTLPGDTNVQASTFMYCLAVFAGSFWAAAVVKRRSLKPSLFICGVFLGLSLLISLHLFSWQEIKLKMLLLKILLTFAAAAGGFVLSLVPYLINKSIKKKRQAQEQRRQRQLEHRQMMQQQRELEQELARRARNNFRP
ncbi:MAG: hypothetical protein HFJ96_06370 [Peptococcaceae bacterium]|jgi:hypothetical protein|nr:hypothetical protein [Peptococcaceae bacterium]